MQPQTFQKMTLQSTFAEASAHFENSEVPLIVEDDSGVFRGLIGDRELRRAVMRGAPPGESVSSIMCFQPLIAAPEVTAHEAQGLLKDAVEEWLVLIDNAQKVSGVWGIAASEQRPHQIKRAILMVGGEGTRLRPLTENTPKPMLPIGGKPILERIVRHISSFGIQQVTMALGYRAHQIEEHFGDGSEFGVTIDYVREKKALGTAGAIGLIQGPLDGPLLVMNGDILTDLDLGAMALQHRADQAAVTVAVRPYQHRIPYGVMRLMDTRVIAVEEKPLHTCWSNAGIYVMESSLVDTIESNTYLDMTLLMERVIAEGDKVQAFPIREYWCDIGLPEDYYRANERHDNMPR